MAIGSLLTCAVFVHELHLTTNLQQTHRNEAHLLDLDRHQLSGQRLTLAGYRELITRNSNYKQALSEELARFREEITLIRARTSQLEQIQQAGKELEHTFEEYKKAEAEFLEWQHLLERVVAGGSNHL